MFSFKTFKESLVSDELGSYISFGIKVFDSSNNEIASVSDVSVSEAFVTELCQRFTLHQLSPVHLLDVIGDIL